MKSVAARINERKRKVECINKIAKWQSSIDGWEVSGSALHILLSECPEGGYQSHFPAHFFSRSLFAILQSHSHFWFLTFFSHSQRPNLSPSGLNPIFPGQKIGQTQFHFTPSGPSYQVVLIFKMRKCGCEIAVCLFFEIWRLRRWNQEIETR